MTTLSRNSKRGSNSVLKQTERGTLERNQDITENYGKFRGSGRVLAAKYGITTQRVEQIAKRYRTGVRVER